MRAGAMLHLHYQLRTVAVLPRGRGQPRVGLRQIQGDRVHQGKMERDDRNQH